MDKNSIYYRGINSIIGPLLFINNVHNVGYNELVQVLDEKGDLKTGIVLETSKNAAVIQLVEHTSGLNLNGTTVKFTGEPLKIPVDEKMMGRVFSGTGQVIDGGPDIITNEYRDVNGSALNPVARDYPQQFIQTGISAIDGMNTLIRGQKLPIFSANGLAHNKLAAQIARQARIVGTDEDFTVIFAALGVNNDVARFFIKTFEETGAIDNVTLFLSLADEPSVERLLTPRVALTLAEYYAFDLDKHVLVILTDMTNYCESLREVSTIRGEIPSRKGYPGYLYSDLASIYERAGQLSGKSGSITQMPILTMPNDDITHPVPDLTGFITEGQIVLERDLALKNIYPPIAGLPSLSRLMKDGIGEGFTRKDHPHLASQLFAAYSKVKDVRALAAVIGEDELAPLDKTYLDFGVKFENEFLNQDYHKNRTIEDTLNLGWKTISNLPKEELHRLTDEELNLYYEH